jgi:hypothetical protein
MTIRERELIKIAKAQHKDALRNKELYKQKRDALIMRIVESPIPLWGGINIIVSKI